MGLKTRLLRKQGPAWMVPKRRPCELRLGPFEYKYNMGNSAQRTARVTRIPEATAVPVPQTQTSGTILEQRLADQQEEITRLRGELQRVRAESERLREINKKLVSDTNRSSLILLVLVCTIVVLFYKYCTNGVFDLKLHEQPAFSNLKSHQQYESVQAAQAGKGSIGHSDQIKEPTVLLDGSKIDSANSASIYFAMQTLLLSALNIAMLLYGLGILISFAGFVAILLKLDADKQYNAKFAAAFIFQHLFHTVGHQVMKNQEVLGSFIFICSIFAVFACFLEGNQIALDRYILRQLRPRNDDDSQARDMDWQIFAIYITIICYGDASWLPGFARFQDMQERKQKKYLQDGTFNLLISSFATGVSCLYYYNVYKPFILYLIIGFISFFLTYVTVMIMVSIKWKQRSFVLWENLLFSYAGMLFALHVFNTFVPVINDSNLHYATVVYIFVPYMMLYPTMVRKCLHFDDTIASCALELIVASIVFMSLALTMQTHIFLLPHVIVTLCFLVFKYGWYILVSRASLYGSQVSEDVRELRQLTKMEKLFDVFTINMFGYLMLMLALNEFYRRTFRPHQDRYIIESFGWTGLAIPMHVVLKTLTRLTIALSISGGIWIIIRYSFPLCLERSAISWLLALVMATIAKYEAGTIDGIEGSKIILYTYDILTIACFCMSSTSSNSSDKISDLWDLFSSIGLSFEKPTDLLYNCYYGLRLASVAPNLLGIPFSCMFIVPSISIMCFDWDASLHVIAGGNNNTRVTKPILSRMFGLGMSLFIMVVAIQLQSKIYALVTCFGVYTFIASCCISLGANGSVRLIVFSLCGFCTLLTARKLDMDFDYLSESALSSTPVYIKWIFTMVFGSINNNKKLPPVDLRLVEWLIGIVL